MTKQTKVRLSLLLLILALTGFTAFPNREAEAWPQCNPYGFDCQLCANREDSCLAGITAPECGGDPTCCYNKQAPCWACCIWW